MKACTLKILGSKSVEEEESLLFIYSRVSKVRSSTCLPDLLMQALGKYGPDPVRG